MPKTAPTETFSHFSKDAVAFLVELAANNDRDWFKANQSRYEASVREPSLAFIRALAPHLKKISPHVEASDKKVGGSLMRPQRDTRFASDKTPYKTNVGIHFRHRAGKDVHSPGLYFHFDPDEVFLGVGIWHPDAPTLARIRAFIDEKPAVWRRALADPAVSRRFEIAGDTLKRPPKGYADDHPMIEHLKRKDHILIAKLPPSLLHKKTLVPEVVEGFGASKPFFKVLHQALGLAF